MSTVQVDIVDQQDRLQVPLEDVVSIAELTFALERRIGHVEVALVDDETIADLHGRYLDDPTPTDVMTFPLTEESRVVNPDATEDGSEAYPRNLGEIVVSTETALRQAPEFGTEPVHEVLLYVVHGVLHLFGYDDREDEDRERMSSRQSAILDAWLAGQRAGESKSGR